MLQSHVDPFASIPAEKQVHLANLLFFQPLLGRFCLWSGPELAPGPGWH